MRQMRSGLRRLSRHWEDRSFRVRPLLKIKVFSGYVAPHDLLLYHPSPPGVFTKSFAQQAMPAIKARGDRSGRTIDDLRNLLVTEFLHVREPYNRAKFDRQLIERLLHFAIEQSLE